MKPEEAIAAQLSEIPSFDAAGATHPGKVREGNEDAFIFGRVGRFLQIEGTNLPPSPIPSRVEQAGWFALVADGIGGRAAGEVASQAALLAAFEATLGRRDWVNRVEPGDIPAVLERMRDLVERVHGSVSDLARADPALKGMGTTFSLARVAGASLLVGHVGDSRVYLLREGKLRQLTTDQTAAQLLADLGEIRPDQVARHRLSRMLTQAVGSGRDILVEARHTWLMNGDGLLIASDGLTKVLDDARIESEISRNDSAQEVVDRLIDCTLEGGAPDNVTVVFARVSRLPAVPEAELEDTEH